MLNFATIIICVLLALAVFAVLRKLRRDKRAGKHSCGGSCASCAMSEGCKKK